MNNIEMHLNTFKNLTPEMFGFMDLRSYEKEAVQVALEALQEKAERDNPQPLTLEQLKQRVGKPVWCSKNKQYGIVYTVSDEYYGIRFVNTCDTAKYFMTNPIYDYEPKEKVKSN